MHEDKAPEIGDRVRPTKPLWPSLTTAQPLDDLSISDLSKCDRAISRKLAAAQVALLMAKVNLEGRLGKPNPLCQVCITL